MGLTAHAGWYGITPPQAVSFFKTQHEDMSQLQVLTYYLAIMKVKILGYSMQLPRLGRLAAITAEVLKKMVLFHHVEIHLNDPRILELLLSNNFILHCS